ncbi:MAG: hypothetical protein HY597_06395 [Candidatus Omnitrophica bacterium]|nr:hypothetical protein [Candidatus Omnitrophota bacterium]
MFSRRHQIRRALAAGFAGDRRVARAGDDQAAAGLLTPMITLSDFQRVELRVGEIRDVQDHPNADRLYLLKVTLGGEERQVVAGIKLAYPDKSALIGKQVIVVANLEPATIRGVESCGMVLAATDPAGLVLLSTASPAAPGSPIK